ncbi:MAG: hypothetical protein ACJ786_05290 [Catenulispora sp.]
MTQDSLPVGRGTETAGRAPTARPAPEPLPRNTMITWALLGVGYALVAGSFARLTVPAELATLLPGAGLLWYAKRPATPRFAAPDRIDGRGVLPWAVVGVAFGIWELYAALRGSTPAHPTLSILMRPLIDPAPARAIGYGLWLAGGLWVVRR